MQIGADDLKRRMVAVEDALSVCRVGFTQSDRLVKICLPLHRCRRGCFGRSTGILFVEVQLVIGLEQLASEKGVEFAICQMVVWGKAGEGPRFALVDRPGSRSSHPWSEWSGSGSPVSVRAGRRECSFCA